LLFILLTRILLANKCSFIFMWLLRDVILKQVKFSSVAILLIFKSHRYETRSIKLQEYAECFESNDSH
jgi:hypothetical protein